MAVGSRFQDEDGVVADLVQLPHLEEENEVKDVPQRRSGGVAWCRVGGTEYELAGNSRVTWTSAPAHRRGDGDRSRSARLILLGLTATIGTVCLDAVFKGRSEVGTSTPARLALLQSHVDVLRARDFAKVQSFAPPILATKTSIPATPKSAEASGASAASAIAPVPSLTQAEARVAAVVPHRKSPSAQVASVIKGLSAMGQAKTAPQAVKALPPPPVKLDKQTQQGLEKEIRALRKAQEQREMKFMKEAALATAQEIARDKKNEEEKATIEHQEHVSAVARSKLHVQEHLEFGDHHGAKDDVHPPSKTSDEVKEVLRRNIKAKGPAQKMAHPLVKGKQHEEAEGKVEPVVRKTLTPAERKALAAKDAKEAKFRAAEQAKERALAAKMEAHVDHETDMIQSRALAKSTSAAAKKATVVKKLSPKEEEEHKLQERVARMIEHTDQKMKQKEYEQRVEHAKQLLHEEIDAARRKEEATEAAKKKAAKARKEREAEEAKARVKKEEEEKAHKAREAAAKKKEEAEAAAAKKAAKQEAAKQEAAKQEAARATRVGMAPQKVKVKASGKKQTAEEEEEVERKKARAEKKAAMLKAKIAALHKLLHNEEAEEERVQKEGLAAASPSPQPKKQGLMQTITAWISKKEHTLKQQHSASPARSTAKTQGLREHVAEPVAVKEAASKEPAKDARAVKGGERATAPVSVARQQDEPRKERALAADRTSAAALKEGQAVAQRVMQLMAERKLQHEEKTHPRRYNRELESRQAAKALLKSRHIIEAAEEEHVAGINRSPGQAGAEAFGAFA